jgi:hypothetical protein
MLRAIPRNVQDFASTRTTAPEFSTPELRPSYGNAHADPTSTGTTSASGLATDDCGSCRRCRRYAQRMQRRTAAWAGGALVTPDSTWQNTLDLPILPRSSGRSSGVTRRHADANRGRRQLWDSTQAATPEQVDNVARNLCTQSFSAEVTIDWLNQINAKPTLLLVSPAKRLLRRSVIQANLCARTHGERAERVSGGYIPIPPVVAFAHLAFKAHPQSSS